MSLFRSIATIGGLTAVGRVLGFVRDMLLAALLGAGPVADAFFVALRFPNLFRSLFAEARILGGVRADLRRHARHRQEGKAIAFAEQTLAVLTTAVGLRAADGSGDAAGNHAAGARFIGGPSFDLAVEFSRLTFPYLLFISLTSLQGGVLNELGKFAAPAATPILLNLSLITALLGTGPLMPTMGHALAWGVVAGGIAQFLWLLASCGREGVWLDLPRPG